jgi:phage terminase large subunit-like protein
MTREEKDKAVEILRERLAVQREEIARIEPRLLEYFEGLVSQPSVHSGWEILCAVKFLRLKRTYQFNHKKVRQVIRLREGEWQQDKDGRWRYIRGGIAQPGTQRPTVYRWEPFQIFVLASVFGFQGWIDTQMTETDKTTLLDTEKVGEDGHIYDLRRLCTDFTFFGPRKTDKTGLSAFIQVVFFLLEDQNSEAYCCANSADQSKVLFSRTVQMLRQLDDGHRFRITQTVADWRPQYQMVRNSSIRPLSAGGKTKDGLFAQLCCADEYGSAPYTNGRSDMKLLVDVISSSMGARREPLVFTTTTAGRILHGPFIEKLESLHRLLMREMSLPPAPPKGRGEGLAQGEGNENENENQNLLAYDRTLCLLLEPDDWEKTDEELLLSSKDVRKKVNPMLGKIVQHQFYDDGAAKARLEGDTGEYISKFINVYQSATVSEWIKPEQVRELQVEMRIDDCKMEDGWEVYAAFDFSHGDDFDAVTFLAYNVDTHEYFADCDAWVNKEAFDKSPYHDLYVKWEREGWLHVSGESVVAPEAPIQRIMELDGKGVSFIAFGYDAKQSKEPILLLKEWLFNEVGITKPDTMVVAVSQVFSNYNASVQKIDYCFGGAVKLRLSNSPLWPFEFANCQLEEDIRMGNKKPLKRTPNAKVDNIQCLCSCFNLEESFES